MKPDFEKFANMDFLTWASVMTVAILSTIVRLLVEAEKLSFRGFVVGSVLAAFLAYITALFCMEIEMSGQMMGVTVGLVTYQAVNILTGLGKLGAAFAKDPIALAEKIRNIFKK